jgi:hypothetical protein
VQATNVPVLVGPVPLLYVQSLTVSDGYRVERVLGSRFSQLTQPTTKTIAIAAVLLGPERLVQKKALEALALASRLLVATLAPAVAGIGIAVVSGLTVSLDMQITELRFTQNTERRDALDVSLTLQHVPRASVTAALSEVADLALAAGTGLASTGPLPNPIPRVTIGALI